MVDPALRLPGIYMARVVATLCNDANNENSPGAHGSPRWSEVPLGSKDAEQLNSPSGKCKMVNDVMTSQETAVSGERPPELPPNRLQVVDIDRLQGEESFLPVGNRFGNQADTETQNSGRKGTEVRHTKETEIPKSCKGGRKIVGYVPIQIINLSQEDVKLSKHT
jgi:hypothetical protein